VPPNQSLELTEPPPNTEASFGLDGEPAAQLAVRCKENNMFILPQLKENKGTISSALGKSLAEKVLNGKIEILDEAIELIKNDNKNVRAGAAKIIEMVAEKKPEFVAGHLERLISGLEVHEPQTRWMLIHTFGYCAKLNPTVSTKAFGKAKDFLEANSGACLWDRTILYLGDIGALSKEQAKKVFPILQKALTSIPSQTKTILESFEKMIPVLDTNDKKVLLEYAIKYSTDSKSSVRNKANKLSKKLKK
jgi:ribosomal silencing factor RsfS